MENTTMTVSPIRRLPNSGALYTALRTLNLQYFVSKGSKAMQKVSSIAILIGLPIIAILFAVVFAPKLIIEGRTYDLAAESAPPDARVVMQSGKRYALWTAQGAKYAVSVYRELPPEEVH
jgi:hypothetical protein